MDIKTARAFLAVAEELNFRRAAERLHIAQPPLSRTIRSLESRLGAELFTRDTRKVVLTPVGAALVDPARELVMQSERIHDVVRRVKRGEYGSVRVGFSGVSVNSIIGRVAQEIRGRKPGFRLELSSTELSDPGLERLISGELDVIVGRWDFLPRAVDSFVIRTESLLLALPDGHELASLAEVPLERLADEPWVVLPGGNSATLSRRLHELGRRGRFVPKVVETVPDSLTQLLMVEAGVGVALTFSSVRENLPTRDLVFRRLAPDPGEVDVRLAWLRDTADPAVTSLMEVVKGLARKE